MYFMLKLTLVLAVSFILKSLFKSFFETGGCKDFTFELFGFSVLVSLLLCVDSHISIIVLGSVYTMVCL
jgi:hypothetical protein